MKKDFDPLMEQIAAKMAEFHSLVGFGDEAIFHKGRDGLDGQEILDFLDRRIAEIKRERSFASPTSAAYLAPLFTLGLPKEIERESEKIGFRAAYVYLTWKSSKKTPKASTQVQLNILDDLPEERLANLQRVFSRELSAYGLQCLYLVFEECDRNGRQSWFNFDINRALDLLGHKRDKKGRHYTKFRKRLRRHLRDLQKITFNAEWRITKKEGKKRKDQITVFTSPIISTTGEFKVYEVDPGRPLEEGKLIEEGQQIFINPKVYAYMTDKYTHMPKEFLKIPASEKPLAILLYSYIANQWRIGWHQYGGIIKQPLHQVLHGAGLLWRLPKRKNQQRDFLNKIKESLRWLKDNEALWIKSVRFQIKDRVLLEQVVRIEMSDDHPLKQTMKALK